MGSFCLLGMGLDGSGDLFVIVEEVDAQCTGNENTGNQRGGLDTLGSCRAGTVSTLTQQQGADDGHDALAQLVDKIPGSQEQTGTN